MTNRTWALGSGVAAALAALAVAFLASPAAHAAEPVVVFQNVNEGDELGAAPYVLQLCFAEPINPKPLNNGGDYAFTLLSNQNQPQALRISLQQNGYGAAIYPLDTASPASEVPTTEGNTWTLRYRVADDKDGARLEGEIHFTVKPGAGVIPRDAPPACTDDGGTAVSLVEQQETTTDTPRPTRTPNVTPDPNATTAPAEESPGESGSGSATATPVRTSSDGGDDDDGGGSDVLPIVLLAIGAVGLIGGIAVVVYLMRKRAAPGAGGPPASS